MKVVLSMDEKSSTTRAQPNCPTINFLNLILGNENDFDGFAPDAFDSYERGIRSPEVATLTLGEEPK
jgi:hypothetical protein